LSKSRASTFFDALNDNAISIVTTDNAEDIEALGAYGKIVQCIRIPEWLSGTEKPIYLLAMQKMANIQNLENAIPPKIASINSWNDLKTLIDETLIRLEKNDAANEFIGEASDRIENRYQRPYLAFSKVGTSSTMVPKNLQSALGTALSRLQDAHGPVDQFVSDELGVGDEMLGKLFSPEQVDAVALTINRIQSGRGFILGDETGIGKGRVIAAAATWANKQGKRVIFITDRSNLFSDLARDLIDINEWERFRPIMTNTDGRILDIMGDAEDLVSPMSAVQFKRIMQMDTQELNANIIFTTYSQINTEKSEKAAWLQSLCKDALVICDEAHVAAGSDSNTAKQTQMIVDNSWGVLYSSATWAKSSKNLHIYGRALPESVNITQVITAMKEEGESFGEVFSSMLAADGAFIRREHDLSKIDFVIEPDNEHATRNEEIAGQVSEILSMMAVLSGDINNMLQKMNSETRNALLNARDARDEIKTRTREHEKDIADRRKTLKTVLENKTLELNRIYDELRVFLSGRDDARGENNTFAQLVSQPGFIEDVIDARNIHEGLGEESSELQFEQYRNALNEHRQAEAELKEFNLAHRSEPSERMKSTLFASSFGTGSAIYQVMRRTLAALSIDHTAEKAIQSVQNGRRPVIVFEETGEAFVQKFIKDEYARIQAEVAEYRTMDDANKKSDKNQELRELADLLDTGTKPGDIVRNVRVPNLQDMMRDLMTHLGGVKVVDPDILVDKEEVAADIQIIANTRLENIPGLDAEKLEQYQLGIQAIAEKINDLPALPIVPVDALRTKFNAAGLSLGEISGRQYALEPIDHENQWTPTTRAEIVRRARKKSDVTQMVKAFNAGRIDGLVINKSAATGLSIHASPRFEDSRQRELFEMQSDENPTNRIQLFGRVNRFDQVIAPRIMMMTTGLKGEQRTIMMQNKKLKNLSANIRSSRENAALIEDVPDLLNRTGDRICQEYLLENPGIASRLDIPMSRINIAHGLSHLLTQRIALLAPHNQEKVYDDLRVAYDEAQIENDLTLTSDQIITRDWKAKTVSEHIAWGPSEHLDVLSVFDGPVYQREVEFTQNYQPYLWEDVGKKIAQSSQRLSEDSRIKPMHILSVEPDIYGEILPEFVLEQERTLSLSEQHNKWVRGLLDSMAQYLPAEALRIDNIDIDRAENEIESEHIQKISKYVPLEFSALGACWIAAHSRMPGTRVSKRLMVLVSRSGETAKLWFLDEQGKADQYLINLVKAVKQYDNHTFSAEKILKKIDPVYDITEDSWQRKRFNQVWGSIDPDVKLLDFSELAKAASAAMGNKQIIALRGTGVDSIEEAMSSGEHNAVKEAAFRKSFFERVLHKLTPGTQIYISDHEENRKFASLVGKNMVIADVKIPPTGHEGVLSRWQFTLLAPGEENPIVLSGALLFKLSGKAPSFMRMTVTGNLYMGMGNAIERAAEQFNRYPRGPILRKRTVLVGNMFQAGEWARDSKRGIPIVYTDNAGQRHRAVEVESSGLFQEQIRFPLRLFDRQSIVQFVERLHDHPEAHENHRIHDTSHFLYTSFKGVLVAQRSPNQYAPDKMIIDTRANAIGWMVDKEEKERIRRALRNAVRADQNQWQEDHPDTPYPISFATNAARAVSKSHKQIMLTIKLPETSAGRMRFMDLFVKHLGLQLFVPDNLAGRAVTIAREIERERYARLAHPALEDRKRAQDAREQRQKMRQMLTTAFQNQNVSSLKEKHPEQPHAICGEDKNGTVHIFSQHNNQHNKNHHPPEHDTDVDFSQQYQAMGGR